MNIIEIICNAICGNPECPDTDYLTERMKTLSDALAHCIGSVDIIENYQYEVIPHAIISDYDIVTADVEYLVYDLEDWKAIMYRLHSHLGNKIKYHTDVSDCDNFALLYASILAYSAYRAGLSKQPAFCIMWSDSHAYNGLIDSNRTVWIVEPQSGDIIGRLGDNNGEMYETKKIWFLS